jgi:hypothetical protein
MKDVNKYLGQFCVVETTQRQYVGVLAQTVDEDFTVLTGVAGRPPVFDLADIDDITLVSTLNKKEK